MEFESANSIQNRLVFLGKKGEERGGRVREESGRFPRFELVGLVARATIGSAEERERGRRKKKGGPRVAEREKKEE